MGVDLEKISKISRAKENGLRPGKGVAVLDRVALRQSWASQGQASYWVDILWDSESGMMQTYRSWRFPKNGKYIEGFTWKGKATLNKEEVCESFTEAVRTQMTKGYVMDERQYNRRSPARKVKFREGQPPIRGTVLEESEDETPAIYAREKGTHDWW